MSQICQLCDKVLRNNTLPEHIKKYHPQIILQHYYDNFAGCELPVNYNELHWAKRREVREEYIRRQNGLCYYCGKPLKGKPDKTILKLRVTKSLFPENFFQYPVHLHHHHETGMTIGAIHCYCNAVLWQYEGE